MRIAPQPPNEKDRLEALRRYKILDTAAESALDNLAQLAAAVCETPTALVSLVDEHRQWFKARVGLDAQETPRDVAFCSHAILDSSPFVVEDAALDNRFSDNPLVRQDPKIRFYAGAPLEVKPGLRIGTLCVIDYKPRVLEPKQLKSLTLLRDHVVRELENRRLTEENRSFEERIASSEERYRDLVENAYDLVQSVDADGRLIFVNRAWSEKLGYSAEEAAGMNILDIIHPEHQPRCRAILQQIARSGAPAGNVETTLVAKDGTSVYVEGSITARIKDGRMVATRGIFRDVTERRRVEAALRETEARFRQITENIAEVFWIRSADGRRVHYVSNAYETIWGRPRDDVYRDAENWIAAIHIEDRARISAEFFRHVSEGHFDIEYRIVRPDGKLRWIHDRGSPVRDAAGTTTHLAGIAEDITERYALELAQRREGQIATALARVGEVLLSALDSPDLLDRLCRITAEVMDADFSHTIQRNEEDDTYSVVAGFEREPEHLKAAGLVRAPREMVREEIAAIERGNLVEVDALNPKTPLEELDQALGMRRVLHVGLRRGDGVYGIQTAGYRERSDPFTGKQRELLQRLAKLAALALEAARRGRKLEAATSIKTYFASTLAHELRGTFAIVNQITEMLADNAARLHPEDLELVENLGTYAREGLDIIDVTLQLFHAEAAIDNPRSGKDEPVAQTLRGLRESFQLPVEREGIELIWDLAPDLPVLSLDSAKLKIVVRNLVGNAIKFTQRGTITVVCRERDAGLEISVVDTGIGIPHDQLPTLFDPFHQAHGSVSRSAGGAGLGLHIVHRLVTLLGGTIDVESEVGRGSTFRVRFPLPVAQTNTPPTM